MGARLDSGLMVKAATMYYVEGLKQEEIAARLGVSRSLVSMILARAKETGIVEIRIRDPSLSDESLARSFVEAFPGLSCFVVPSSSRDPDALRGLVAERAAEIAAAMLEDSGPGPVVGLAWGRTCLAFVEAFRPRGPRPGSSVVPLIGGSRQAAPYHQINELARRLAERLGGSPLFIHAPALARDRPERELYMGSAGMGPVAERWRAMDLIVFSLGTLPRAGHRTAFRSVALPGGRDSGGERERESYIGESEMLEGLDRRGAVGDICARYFDSSGRFIRDEHYDRVIGAGVEDIMAARNRLCLASGVEKAAAIVGALKTGAVTTLVLDEGTAKAAIAALGSARP
jgi:deoxyribonucleoside regulator